MLTKFSRYMEALLTNNCFFSWFTSQYGFVLFHVVDYYGVSVHVIVFIAIAEIVVIAWVYGK